MKLLYPRQTDTHTHTHTHTHTYTHTHETTTHNFTYQSSHQVISQVAQLRAVGGEIEGVWGSVQAVEAALRSNGRTYCHLLVDQLQETHFPVKTFLTLHNESLIERLHFRCEHDVTFTSVWQKTTVLCMAGGKSRSYTRAVYARSAKAPQYVVYTPRQSTY